MKLAIGVAVVVSVFAAIAGYAAKETDERHSISPTVLTIKYGRNLPSIEPNGI